MRKQQKTPPPPDPIWMDRETEAFNVSAVPLSLPPKEGDLLGDCRALPAWLNRQCRTPFPVTGETRPDLLGEETVGLAARRAVNRAFSAAFQQLAALWKKRGLVLILVIAIERFLLSLMIHDEGTTVKGPVKKIAFQ